MDKDKLTVLTDKLKEQGRKQMHTALGVDIYYIQNRPLTHFCWWGLQLLDAEFLGDLYRSFTGAWFEYMDIKEIGNQSQMHKSLRLYMMNKYNHSSRSGSGIALAKWLSHLNLEHADDESYIWVEQKDEYGHTALRLRHMWEDNRG